jgi:pimeloyl-ACP methyl ester carboxylesterase
VEAKLALPSMTTSGQFRIAYDDWGFGEPALLLLPGWCADRTVFQELAQRLSANHRVLALDWRGHGDSERPAGDFGAMQLVEDALAVIEDSGAEQIVPISLEQGGWVALELRRRLRSRIPKLVLTEWLVLEPPAQFLELIQKLQSPKDWRQAVLKMFSIWLNGTNALTAVRFVYKTMGSYSFDMWSRAAREIGDAYWREETPLNALLRLDQPPPVLHLYGEPVDPSYLVAQQAFAFEHPWFEVMKLDAHSHFSLLEIPGEVARVIETFLRS